MRSSTLEKILRYTAIVLMIWAIIVEAKEMIPLLEFYLGADAFFELAMDISDSFLMVVGIIYLTFTKRKSIPKVMSVLAIIIGYDFVVEAYIMLVEYNELVMETDILTKIQFFLDGTISLVIAVMLIFNAIVYIRGISKSASLIKYATLIIIALQVLGIISDLRGGATIAEIWDERSHSVPQILILFELLYITTTEQVKIRTVMYSITSSIKDLRNSLSAVGATIGRPILKKLCDNLDSNGLWCCSYSFILTTFYKEYYLMSLTKVDGKSVVRLSSVENRSGLNSFRFVLTGIWVDTGDVSTCDLVRFYGEDGMFIQLIVGEPETFKKKRVPRFGSLRLASREEGTRSHGLNIIYWKVSGAIREFKNRHELLEESKEMEEDESDEDSL